MRQIGLVFSIVFSGGNSWANDCRTVFDLGDGLRFEYESGFSETFVMLDNGVVETTRFRPNGARFERRLDVGGFFETSYEDFDAAGENSIYSFKFSYSFPLDGYTPPTTGTSVSGTQFETGDDGYTYRNRYKLKIGEERTIAIDGCQFTWWEVEYSYGHWWDFDKDWAMYFPELGILLRFQFDIPYNLNIIRSAKILLGS